LISSTHFAAQQFHAGDSRGRLFHGAPAQLFEFGALPVVQGDGGGLVLQQQARVLRHERGCGIDGGLQVRRRHAGQAAVGHAVLRAVLAGHRQDQGSEEMVDVGNAASGDDRHGAVEPLLQRGQCPNQADGHAHCMGLGSDFGERSIEVEKQGRVWSDEG
jgi:hypothetical protein